MHCCFLSTDDLEGYEIDDDLAVGPLNDLGLNVETVSWHADREWSEFDIVAIRTTWDYHRMPQKFLASLKSIADADTSLQNSLDIVEWNIDKRYLKELNDLGIPIVPTEFSNKTIAPAEINNWKQAFDSEELVIKPTISATARNTFRVKSYSEQLDVHAGTTYMVQPMVTSVKEDGETSLFYFNSNFSHAVQKVPKKGDFRVQEDFGGNIFGIDVNDELKALGRKILDVLNINPLYSRIDVVRGNDGKWQLMELELIEPALYFRYVEDSAGRFAQAIVNRINEF